ncbi:hypothetical protein ACYOEI_39360, partial [Singulisphaera rosea]
FTITAKLSGKSLTTAPIASSASAADVQDALNQLGLNVAVTGTGTPESPWLIQGSGLTTMSADGSKLTDGLVGQNYRLRESAVSLYKDQAAAALGIADPSADQIQAYAGDLYRETVAFLEANVAGWHDLSDFQIYNPDFAYNATTDQINALTKNAVLTEAQLSYSVNTEGAEPTSAEVPAGASASNITGGVVSLSASGGIGQFGQTNVLTLAQLKSGDITSDQASALASATAPGDLQLVGTDSQGNEVTFSYDFKKGIIPVGVTVTGVRVRVDAPLLVSAETLNASSGADIFARSQDEDLRLGQVSGG